MRSFAAEVLLEGWITSSKSADESEIIPFPMNESTMVLVPVAMNPNQVLE